MALNDNMVPTGPDIFYDESFRNVLEDHMAFLRDNYSSVVMLNPDESYQWRGDLFGLLHVRQYQRQYHWLIMRLNQYTAPSQFTEDTLALLVPDFDVVERIMQSHNSTPRIS